ncbi:MAG: hypothetical protein ACLTTW_03940 [Coprobacter sp.]
MGVGIYQNAYLNVGSAKIRGAGNRFVKAVKMKELKDLADKEKSEMLTRTFRNHTLSDWHGREQGKRKANRKRKRFYYHGEVSVGIVAVFGVGLESSFTNAAKLMRRKNPIFRT